MKGGGGGRGDNENVIKRTNKLEEGKSESTLQSQVML